MFKLLSHPLAPETGAAALVAIVAALVGRQAALGMDVQQWTAAAASVAGAILVAVLVHTRPQGQQVSGEPRRDP